MPSEQARNRSDPGPHPLPPPDLPRRALPLAREARAWYRFHAREHPPLFFSRTGRYRFDAPGGEFGVLYAGADAHCAFIETFGQTTGLRLIHGQELQRRNLVRLDLARPLALVDLTGAGLARLGADERLCAGDYTVAQRWALALHDHPGQPDGLLYRARHDPSRCSVAIFERAAAVLSPLSLGSLADREQRALLADILDHYGFGILGDLS